jgi:hypothetical protein
MVVELLEGAKTALELAPAAEEPCEDMNHFPIHDSVMNGAERGTRSWTDDAPSNSDPKETVYHLWIHAITLYLCFLYTNLLSFYHDMLRNVWRRKSK